jgi:phosphotransferase system IIA component
MKVHPHAFVLLDESGAGVLVHLGIDTVKLEGEGFTVHVSDGDEVERGARMITWNPTAVRGAGYSAVCPVVVMQSKPDDVEPAVAVGASAVPGAPLFTWSPAPGS